MFIGNYNKLAEEVSQWKGFNLDENVCRRHINKKGFRLKYRAGAQRAARSSWRLVLAFD